MTTARYLVIGGAGYAQEVAWSLEEATRVRGESCEMFFFDDGLPVGRLPSGLGDVVGGLEAVEEYARRGSRLVLGVGLPRTKRAVVERLSPLKLPWATVVHPGATIGPNVRIGEGTYVGAGAILTVNVAVGRFVTINLHAQIAHDDVVGDFTTVHPDVHLSGCVTIGESCELGTSSSVIPGVTIGDGAVLGAGCVAIKTLAGGQTYVGVPARELAEPPARTRRRFARG